MPLILKGRLFPYLPMKVSIGGIPLTSAGQRSSLGIDPISVTMTGKYLSRLSEAY